MFSFQSALSLRGIIATSPLIPRGSLCLAVGHWSHAGPVRIGYFTRTTELLHRLCRYSSDVLLHRKTRVKFKNLRDASRRVLARMAQSYYASYPERHHLSPDRIPCGRWGGNFQLACFHYTSDYPLCPNCRTLVRHSGIYGRVKASKRFSDASLYASVAFYFHLSKKFNGTKRKKYLLRFGQFRKLWMLLHLHF